MWQYPSIPRSFPLISQKTLWSGSYPSAHHTPVTILGHFNSCMLDASTPWSFTVFSSSPPVICSPPCFSHEFPWSYPRLCCRQSLQCPYNSDLKFSPQSLLPLFPHKILDIMVSNYNHFLVYVLNSLNLFPFVLFTWQNLRLVKFSFSPALSLYPCN